MRWRQHDPAPDAEWSVSEEWEAQEAGGWSTGARGNLTTLLRWGAWALLVCSPVLALGAWMRDSAPAAAQQLTGQMPVPAQQDAAGPAGFAELYVSAYLGAGEGGEREVAAFWPPAADLVFTGGGQVPVERLAAVEVEPAGERYWSVTVAAHMAEMADAEEEEAAEGSGLRFFTVAVRAADGGRGGYVATSLPAETAAPAPGEVGLDYGSPLAPSAGDPVADTLTAFFTALLAGGGEVDRYLSPGAAIPAVTPAPYGQVRLTQLAQHGQEGAAGDGQWPAAADGARLRLLVDLEAEAAPAGSQAWMPMTYAVTVRARDGRWEVASIADAPALPHDADAARDEGGEQR
ncbi:conjugal transfer protein [Streptomyces aculeolatus]